MTDSSSEILTLPPNIGRVIVESARQMVCPLLGTSDFVKYCRERNVGVTRDRLLRFERLGIFAPIFRVRTPEDEGAERLAIPIRDGNNWFEKGWAWDTTMVPAALPVPANNDDCQEAYYSRFQIDDLRSTMSMVTLQVDLENFATEQAIDRIDWKLENGRWQEHARQMLEVLRKSQFRFACSVLCQFISDRYYPNTQSDMRTHLNMGSGTQFDQWRVVHGRHWNWHSECSRWNPKHVESLFLLSPKKLQHAYEGLAVEQSSLDPLDNWYMLVQFVKVQERRELKGDALLALALREAALMLRMLYKDLYGEELRHPNEVSRTVITPIPEYEVRKDARRYLEFVVNRFGLNPQLKAMLIVEGLSEKRAITRIFEEWFGFHPGVCGIEIMPVLGIGNATGGRREDRSRAIVRLVDYLHNQQTLVCIVLDRENDSLRLKTQLGRSRSIHGVRSHVTRDEYIHIWSSSFEFDNWSDAELSTALSAIAGGVASLSADDVERCRREEQPAARLNERYKSSAGGRELPKLELADALVDLLLANDGAVGKSERPIVRIMRQVVDFAMRNSLPVTEEIWQKNQESGLLANKE